MAQNNHTTNDGGSGTAPVEESVFDQLLREEHDHKMLLGALYYASLDIPVFPVGIDTDAKGKVTKKPRISNWPIDASVDHNEIANWWGPAGQFRGCLIGAVTGKRSGWCVIDVDVKNNGQGMQSLDKLADEFAPLPNAGERVFGQLAPELRLAPSGLARTRSGGLHLWYRLGEHAGVRGTKNIHGLPSIDFQATGQYVVVAPSDGYEWLRQLPAELRPDEISSDFLATAPVISKKLLDRLNEGREPGSGNYNFDADDGDDTVVRYLVQGRGESLLKDVTDALAELPDGLGIGNESVYQAALDLYSYVVLGELSREQVEHEVLTAISHWDYEDKARQTLTSAWDRSQRRTFKSTAELPDFMRPVNSNSNSDVVSSTDASVTDGDVPMGEVVSFPSHSEVPAATQPAKSADDDGSLDIGPTGGELEQFIALLPDDMKDDVDQRAAVYADVQRRHLQAVGRDVYEQLTDESNSWSETDLGDDDSDPEATVLRAADGRALLYLNEKNMIWGKGGAGKSWMAYLAMVQQVQAGRHVILFDYENGKKRVRSRLLMLGLTSPQIKEYVHVYFSQSGGVPVKRMPVSLDKIGLVVTDSYTGGLSAMDLDARTTGDIDVFCRRNVSPFTAAGVAVLIIDHVVKDETQHDRPINSVGKLNRVQGAGYQLTSVDPFRPGAIGYSWITLWKDNSGALDWTRGDTVGKLVIDATDPDNIKASIDTNVSKLAVLSSTNGIEERKVAELIAKLDLAGISADLGVNKTRDLMKQHEIAANQGILIKAVRERKST